MSGDISPALAAAIKAHRSAFAAYNAAPDDDDISGPLGIKEGDAKEAVFLHPVETVEDLRAKLDYLATLPDGWIDGLWIESHGRWSAFLASIASVRAAA